MKALIRDGVLKAPDMWEGRLTLGSNWHALSGCRNLLKDVVLPEGWSASGNMPFTAVQRSRRSPCPRHGRDGRGSRQNGRLCAEAFVPLVSTDPISRILPCRYSTLRLHFADGTDLSYEKDILLHVKKAQRRKSSKK